MTAIIRDVRPSDFDDIVRNFYSYFDELTETPDLGLILFKEKPTLSEELSWFADFYDSVEKGDTVGLVAEEDTKVVGICEVHGLRPDSDISHRGELGIVVRKDSRGKGVGTALMKEALTKCKGKFELVQLAVFSTNRARRLYEELGFVTYGHLPMAIKRGTRYYDEDLMYLKL